MANIFLSYVRRDADRARALAALLERSGHLVWWDRQIKGGSQYSIEIEAALAAAEKVVVLWSAEAVKSAWVRDEAAAGRDTGRLVPVTLDDIEPPLGFRQFQTIDLSNWKGRTKSEGIDDLLDAVGVASAPAERSPPETRPTRTGYQFPRRLIGIAATFAFLIVGGGWWWASRTAVHPPTVAIKGVNDRSREVARQLAFQLSDLQSARVDAFELIPGGDQADLILQVDAADSASTLRRDVSILSGNNRSLLWSASLQQPPDRAADLSQQLTITSERVLSCALEAFSDRRDRIDPATLKLYLGGCSRLQDVYGEAQFDPSLGKLFEQVIAKAPNFEGAWAKLLATEAIAVDAPDPPSALVTKLHRHIERAQRLGVKVGELDLAKAVLLSPDDFFDRFALANEAVERDPQNPFLYRVRGEWLQSVGQMNASVADSAQAFQLDPLSPSLADGLLSALAYSGKVDAAYARLRQAEANWPAADNIQFARYRLDLRFGDPKEALARYRSQTDFIDPVQGSFIQARIDPSPTNIQRAINEVREENAQEPRDIVDLMQTLGQFGRKDEALNVLLNYRGGSAIGWNAGVLFRPALREMWRDPRSMAAAAHVGFLRYWEKSGKWPDFCFDPTLPYNCKKEAAKYRV